MLSLVSTSGHEANQGKLRPLSSRRATGVIALSRDRDGTSADTDARGGAGWDLDLQKTRAPEAVTLMDRNPSGWRDEAKLA